MAIENSGPAPYGPISAMRKAIEHHRERGLPVPITVAVLQRLGIEQSLARRTFAGMRQLDLVDDSGTQTATFQNIKLASSAEYQQVLADWVRDAYKPIFQYADPAVDSEDRIIDLFRHYEPSGMRSRMVTLFYGLCEMAGIIESTPKPGRKPGKPQKGKSAAPAHPKPKAAPTTRPAPASTITGPPLPASPMRERYLDMLIKRAEGGDADADLLDRIERALGIPAKGSP